MSSGLGWKVRTQFLGDSIGVAPRGPEGAERDGQWYWPGGGRAKQPARGKGSRAGTGAGTRVTGATVAVVSDSGVTWLAPERAADAARALDVLLDAELDPIVDMVLVARDGAYEVLSHDGSVRFRRRAGADPGAGFEVLGTEGEDPLADQSTDRFTPLGTELARPYPHRRENAYPFAFEQVAQLFDHPAAPDLCVLHSADAQLGGPGRPPRRARLARDRPGPGAVPARRQGCAGRRPGAPRRPHGRRRADAPRAARVPARPRRQPPRRSGRGGAHDLLDPSSGRPRHVVAFLFDGTNSNVLYDMVGRGECPNVARLLEMGTAYEHGAMAGLPTVTLANHTSVMTGRFPGHHGILHNAWYDRSTSEQVITNSNDTWPWAMRKLLPGVESIHSVLRRHDPDAFTAAVNEPCDHGAGYSTFDWFRRGDVPPMAKASDGLPHSTERFVRPNKDYRWSTVVDHMGVEQAVGIWSGHYQGSSYPHPRFMFCNFTLTDSAMHAGGPHSEIAAASIRDSDARMGEVLAAVERAGVFDDTAFLLIADHGMEENDPGVRGDWDVSLREQGMVFRDEGYGFLYLGEEPSAS